MSAWLGENDGEPTAGGSDLGAVASTDMPAGISCNPVGSGPPCPSLPVGPTPVTCEELLEGWDLVEHDSVGGELLRMEVLPD